MKEMTVPIDRAGRIVIPQGIRRELAIEPGDSLKVSIHGASVALTPIKETTGFIRKGKALVFASAGGDIMSQETVSRLLDESREERHGAGSAGLVKRSRRK